LAKGSKKKRLSGCLNLEKDRIRFSQRRSSDVVGRDGSSMKRKEKELL
jgi:hypothetical protein